MRRKLIIVAAPSGAGKSSLMEKALSEFSELVDIFSYTTRLPRPTESQGNPYYFVSVDEFKQKIEEGFFVEWAMVHNNYYGTAKKSLEDAWEKNKWVIMDVDVKGAATLKRQFPEAISIFILPPSIDELRKRLMARDGSNKSKDIDLRLANAVDEMLSAPKFNYQLVNDDFDRSYAELKKIIAECIKNG